MDSIELKRPVMLKVIMTPEFRKQLVDEARDSISRLNDNLESFLDDDEDDETSGSESSDQSKSPQMTSEKERLERMKKELEWKIKEVENIVDGAEVPFRILEGSVQIKVGDDVLEKLSKTEVVVKDWKVIEIRNP